MLAIPVSTPRVTFGLLINACKLETVIMKVPVKVNVWELLGSVGAVVVSVVVGLLGLHVGMEPDTKPDGAQVNVSVVTS